MTFGTTNYGHICDILGACAFSQRARNIKFTSRDEANLASFNSQNRRIIKPELLQVWHPKKKLVLVGN